MRLGERIRRLRAQSLDFAPAILRVQDSPPAPLPRLVLYAILAFVAVLLGWSLVGRLDIIAVAQGKLIPQSFLQVVQPADAGIVKELLVHEGDRVEAGQVLVRMDAIVSDSDLRQLQNDLALKSLQLRRIEAELSGVALRKEPKDPRELFAKVLEQYHERRQAYLDALAQEQAGLKKATEDLSGALELLEKLKQTLPIYRDQSDAYVNLSKQGYVSKLMAADKARERIEKEQDLRAQEFSVASLRASIAQSEKKIAGITSNYRSQLHNEKVEAEGQYRKLTEELGKQAHRHDLLELRAPAAGTVKDLATHTLGSVVSPGTVLMTLVPNSEPVKAEVWITNVDAGFVKPHQPVKVKLAAYPFQRYGMVNGVVEFVSPDSSELPESRSTEKKKIGDEHVMPSEGFRALVALNTSYLEARGERFGLNPGMQVSAEINLGTQTVMQYLLSPVAKTVSEAGRER